MSHPWEVGWIATGLANCSQGTRGCQTWTQERTVIHKGCLDGPKCLKLPPPPVIASGTPVPFVADTASGGNLGWGGGRGLSNSASPSSLEARRR